MNPDRATAAQRVGVLVAFVEACLFGVVAVLHLGIEIPIGSATFSAPFLYPAAIIEIVLALALLLAVVLPGGGLVRAGRVLAAQILAVIGLFGSQVAFVGGGMLEASRSVLFYAALMVLALASIALVASPVYRRRPHISHP